MEGRHPAEGFARLLAAQAHLLHGFSFRSQKLTRFRCQLKEFVGFKV